MKRLLCLFLCIICTYSLLAQDDTRSINVSVNQNEPTIEELDACKLSVMATQFGNSEISLSIEVENTNSPYIYFLFGRAYPEKELKKLKPSIRFDKKGYGTTSREILTCEVIGGEIFGGDDILQIEGDQSRTLTISGVKGEQVKCVLPLYIATSKKRKKYLIMERAKVTLNVTLINEEPDQSVYEGIKQQYDELIAEINNVEICENKKHPQTVEEQEKPYQKKVDDLIDEIETIKDKNNWRERDDAYKPFKNLITQLKNVEFKTHDCEKCKVKPIPPYPHHECSYCSWTPESVWSFMDSTYKKLDQGSMTKNEAKSKVSAVQKAYSSSCPNLRKKVNGNGSLKNKIDSKYQSIVNY